MLSKVRQSSCYFTEIYIYLQLGAYLNGREVTLKPTVIVHDSDFTAVLQPDNSGLPQLHVVLDKDLAEEKYPGCMEDGQIVEKLEDLEPETVVSIFIL